MRLPDRVRDKVLGYYPQLKGTQWNEVDNAVRDFLQLCAVAPSEHLVVPSHLVFLALQEFAQDPFDYPAFCGNAYGRRLTLAPMRKQLPNHLIGRTWELACQQAGVDYEIGNAVPRLFDLDERLGIERPWHFRPDEPDAETGKRREFERLSQGDQTWTRHLPRDRE